MFFLARNLLPPPGLNLLGCQDKLKPDDAERSSIVHEHRGLCQALCHTATAYQCQVNDLDAANDACELAVALIATAEKSSEYDSEGLAMIKLDLLFRQLEVSKSQQLFHENTFAFHTGMPEDSKSDELLLTSQSPTGVAGSLRWRRLQRSIHSA